ncbi:DNA internalization-related competence protein ComEC/Rec2 [Rossellomorea sp. BNER]|uniref:DNA internalization-related competence protein ComEC/Rec2 n=1 Tax=Rossellomorea sp. BNER TaxID=2962031 RepID=UPI003AF2860F|nr:DNA internalization-related competence protein ComEC/Rec2 [Rossellomorea sp. BNER]
MKQTTMVPIALSSLTGVLLALHFAWGAFFLLLLTLHLLQRKPSLPTFIFLFVLTFFFYTHATFNEQGSVTSLSATQQNFKLSFQEMVEWDGNLMKGEVITSKGERIIARYEINTENELLFLKENWKVGMECRAAGTLSQPMLNTNENAFNYRQYLQQKEIYWVLNIEELKIKDCVPPERNLLLELKEWRYNGMKIIKNHFPAEIVGLSQALIFGDRNELSEESLQAYQRLGVIHLLAISGLHVGFLFSLLYFLLVRLGMTKESTQTLLLILLPIYVIITGASPPVIRAAGIVMIVILTKKLQWNWSLLDSLSLSFLVFLLINPQVLFNIGFQLSYIVSFSLMVSSSLLNIPYRILQLLCVTLISQIVSIPIILYHFFEFSIISLIVNLFYVPLFTFIILPLLLVSFLLQLTFPFVNSLLFPVLTVLISKVDELSILLNKMPFITLVLGRPADWLLMLYPGVIILTFLQFELKKWMKGCFLIMSILSVHYFLPYLDSKGEIMFIDVGQGDCILIVLPNREAVYMIDTGGAIQFEAEDWEKIKNTYSVGKDTIVPLLKSKGIRRIDKLLLTHSDMDHIGGAREIINEININQIIISPNSNKKPEMELIVQEAHEKNIDLIEGRKGDEWETKSSHFFILYPEDDKYEGNNDSLVLLGKFGGKTWLFTGDLESDGEMELIRQYQLIIDVLKVGHHGSNSSTTEAFLDELQPEIAIVSAGRKNRYGHPHPEVMSNLSSRKIKVYQTNLDGAIHYKFLGNNGTFTTYPP